VKSPAPFRTPSGASWTSNNVPTATQYALFSSLYALPGKLLMGASGFVVDAIGYPRFFIYTASLSLPGLILLYWLVKRVPAAEAGAEK